VQFLRWDRFQGRTRRHGLGAGVQIAGQEPVPRPLVLENVALHIDNHGARRKPWRHSIRSTRKTIGRAREALEAVGIGWLGDQLVGDLSYGERKLVEFARSTSVALDVLLLDEPLAGVAVQERSRLIDIIGGFLDSSELAVLVVEHDMRAIRGVCSEVNVMISGQIVARGSFDEVVQNQTVRDAYLGNDGSGA
jgi:branched-chain amino acid transport system ATP-binding protein